MNGVSRFLSRRDKHHEKHKSKHLRNKVCKHFLSSPPPSPAQPYPRDRSESEVPSSLTLRHTACLHSLCHNLSSLSISGGDGSHIFCKTSPCVLISPCFVQASTAHSSDHQILQSQTAPSNLYTIFSNEELKIDKDDDKKVSAWPTVFALDGTIDSNSGSKVPFGA